MHKIVWVDDESTEILRLDIEDRYPNEFHFIQFGSGREALNYLSNSIPDLILSDVNMHGMSGREFLIEVRRLKQLDRVPFFFLSGYGEAASRMIGLELGADDYVFKASDDELILRMRNALRRARQTQQTHYEYDLFVSYSSSDRARVVPLAEALRNRGVRVWFDRDIRVGDDFRRAILEVLAKCRNLMVIWTDSSVQSEWVVQEAVLASSRLIPICVGKVEPPLGFRMVQHLRTRTLGKATAAELADAVVKLVGSEVQIESGAKTSTQ